MALKNRTSLNVAYGLNNALQGLAPQPVVAQRAPNSNDTAPISTLWVDQPANTVYVLTSITSGSANWQLLEQSGGAGVFTSLLVNPGPVTTQGTGAVNISADAVATTVNVGTGGAVKTVTLGSTNGASVTTIQSGSGNMVINSGAGTMTIESTNTAIDIKSGTGTITIANDATANIVDIATGLGNKTVTLGNTFGTTLTEVQAGSGGILITAANGTLEIISGTGALSISDDALATTVDIATGAAAKTLVLGSTNTTSASTLQCGPSGSITVNSHNGAITINGGTGTIDIADDATTNAINLGRGTTGAVKTVTLGCSQGASATNIQSGTAGIELNSGTANASAGFISMVPQTGTVAQGGTDTLTINSRFIFGTFTGYTTASNGTQDYIIASSEILTTSALLVNVANLNASTNAASIAIQGMTQAAGTVTIHTKNLGAGALGAGDNVLISCWILN